MGAGKQGEVGKTTVVTRRQPGGRLEAHAAPFHASVGLLSSE